MQVFFDHRITYKLEILVYKSIHVLVIESKAHEFGIGIIEGDGNVLANARDMYKPKKGGIIPREAAEHHVELFPQILDNALKEAKLEMKDIDGIAFSQGPGMGPCLRIGAMAARMLSLKYKIPIYGVNHCVAHIEIARLETKAQDPVVLYVSGGNTKVIAFAAGKYRVFGETMDNSVGNMLDTFARDIGIPHPGGPMIEKLAKDGKNYVELPYIVKGMDLSYGGFYTDVRRKWETGKYSKEDLCYSVQETAFAMLTEVTERAMAHTGKEEVFVTGGVACNERLQGMVQVMAEERGAKFYPMTKELCGDNGVMIAWVGVLMHKAGVKQSIMDTRIDQKWRTDDVPISWL